jgi:hypothetical protein
MEMEAASEQPQEEGHALAVQDIAERLGLLVDKPQKLLTTLEAQPTVTREMVLPQITLRVVPIILLHRLSGFRVRAQPALSARHGTPRSPQQEHQ